MALATWSSTEGPTGDPLALIETYVSPLFRPYWREVSERTLPFYSFLEEATGVAVTTIDQDTGGFHAGLCQAEPWKPSHRSVASHIAALQIIHGNRACFLQLASWRGQFHLFHPLSSKRLTNSGRPVRPLVTRCPYRDVPCRGA